MTQPKITYNHEYKMFNLYKSKILERLYFLHRFHNVENNEDKKNYVLMERIDGKLREQIDHDYVEVVEVVYVKWDSIDQWVNVRWME